MTVRPFFRRLLAWLLPPLLLIAAWQLWDYVAAREFAREAARMEARGSVPASPLRTLIQATNEEDAARYYSAAAIAFRYPQARAPITEDRVRETFEQAIRTGMAVDAETAATAQRWLADNEVSLELLDRAAALPFTGFHPGLRFTLQMGNFMALQSIASIATLDALMRGDIPAALRALVSRLRALRVFDADPGLLGFRVSPLRDAIGDAILVLSDSRTPPDAVAVLAKTLPDIDLDDDIARRLQAGETQVLESTRLATSPGSVFTATLSDRILLFAGRPMLRTRVASQLRSAARAIEAARQPWPDRIEAVRIIPAPLGTLRWQPFSRFTRPLAGNYVGMMNQSADIVALLRCFTVALAVEKDRRASGRMMSSLDDLSVADEARQDPFNGRPLQFASTADGYIVYSVGRNGRDDGGRIEGTPPPPSQTFTDPPLDVGVRISVTR